MCKKCDVRVGTIKDYSFDSKADYMFFRTNFGNQ